jgi:type VI protein secretion system component VasF
MPEQPARDPSEDVAEWMKEVGRRKQRHGARDSDKALRLHLEELTGRKIETREDISDYVAEVSREADARRSRAQYLKNGLLGILLVVAALQYYFIDVQLKILSQPTLTVFVPVKPAS